MVEDHPENSYNVRLENGSYAKKRIHDSKGISKEVPFKRRDQPSVAGVLYSIIILNPNYVKY